MRIRNTVQRGLSSLVVLFMLFAFVPGAVFAEDTGDGQLADEVEILLEEQAEPQEPETEVPDEPQASPVEGPLVKPTAAGDLTGTAYDGWVLGTGAGNEILEVDGEWLHFASGAGDGNNPGSPQPASIYRGGYTMPQTGELSFTLRPVNGASTTRFGVYLGYTNPGNALFVGYDAGGWFWQIYNNNSGDWYGGSRISAPNAGQTAAIVLRWDGEELISATMDGAEMFASSLPLDFSGKGGSGATVGFKAGTYGTEYTDVHIKDIQLVDLAAATYSVAGNVTDEDGEALAGVKVTCGKTETETDAAGNYTLAGVAEGAQTLEFAKDRYDVAEEDIVVDGDKTGIDVQLDYASYAFVNDGVYAGWMLDPKTTKGGETLSVSNGSIHYVSGPRNGNAPTGTHPSSIYLPGYEMPATGELAFTVAPTNDAQTTRFGVYLYYTDPGNNFFVGYDRTGWFWQAYNGNSGDYYSGGRVAAPDAGETAYVELAWNGKTLTSAKVDGVDMFTTALPYDFSSIGGSGKTLGFKGGTFGTELTDVQLYDITFTGQPAVEAYLVHGEVVDAGGDPLGNVTVTAGMREMQTGSDGLFAFALPVDEYSLSAQLLGYTSQSTSVAVVDANVDAGTLLLRQADDDLVTIASGVMEVEVAESFPRVARYHLDGKTMTGQLDGIDTMVINGVSLSPVDVQANVLADRVEYEMLFQSFGNSINYKVLAELVVVDNTLEFNITGVDYVDNDRDTNPLQTIQIPDHSLLSVNSNQQGASFAGVRQSNNTKVSSDTFAEVKDMSAGSVGYYYALLNADGLAGGVWSNSQTGSTGANYRLTNTVTALGSVKTTAVSSSMWYIDRMVTAQTLPNGAIKGAGSWVIQSTEMPSAKVVITGDLNDDGEVDWQDAAIAYRDILHERQGSEEVPELVGWRIVMNFGSMAQNPFLMTLDGVKKVALHTEGLGQSVLLKGYGNEGHDSAHPDYGDIGQRIGGADDMNALMEAGHEYGARFGIHVNAGEMYTEAKAYSENLIWYESNGRPRTGWTWIDQGAKMDGAYDLGSGERAARWGDLKAQVGDNMDFIYLDIWGNGTNSFEDEWATRHIVQEINDNGWMFGTEFAYYAEYEAVYYHWALDQSYGGYEAKGHNSDIMRFISNHQRDVWVADWPGYGGAAIAPLLGGYTMNDFEGWQGRSDYDYWIRNLYTNNLSTKFLQHYEIVEWERAEEAMSGTNGVKPAMYIRLEDTDNGDIVEVSRLSGDYAGDLNGFRSRDIKLNGKTVLQGAKANGTNLTGGDESYLLPWVWDSTTGDRMALADQKLYHWNTAGGTTTWELPDEWSGLANVKVYTLTEQGRQNELVVPVSGGSITLTADAQTPYVVYAGDAKGLVFEEVEWGEGTGLADPGFNSFSLAHWDIEGNADNATVSLTQASNAVLELTGEVALSQSVDGLVGGKNYVAYVAVDNRSDAAAWLEVTVDGEVVAGNYTNRSIAKNYVKADPHSTRNPTVQGNSYFQNMFVYFTAPASGDVQVVLRREAGSGSSYYDNLRVVENDAANITYDAEGNFVSFQQDFEDNAAGIYPFVVGGTEGAEDNRTHLAERHSYYTQAGYEDKIIHDVLDGDWSLKTRVNNANGLNYQTIPQNIRFEPGVTYEISFEYQMGSPDLYQFVVGDGEFDTDALRRYDLEGVAGTVPSTEIKTFTTQIVGAASGQTWVGIIGTGNDVDTSNWNVTFTTKDTLVIDNFSVVASGIRKGELFDLLAVAELLLEADYEPAGWPEFADALLQGQTVMDDMDAVQDDVDDAVRRLQSAMDALVPVYTAIDGTLLGLGGVAVAGAEVRLSSDSLDAQTAVTDAYGKFVFTDIFVRDDYTLRIVVDGYVPVYRQSVAVVANTTTDITIQLEMKTPPDYVADFSEAGVAGWENAAGNSAQVGLSSTQHNGADALSIENGSSARNAVINVGGPQIKYGSIEADITALGSWARFGMAMRVQDTSNLVMASVEDGNNRYFWEYYGGTGGNSYQSYYGHSFVLKDNETYHFKMEIDEDERIRLWIDGVLIFTSTAGRADGMPDEAGYVGFHMRGAGEFIVQNFEVVSYDVVDDTVNITGGVTSRYDGGAIYGAWVELATEGGVLQNRTTTALDGSYTLKNVPQSATYALRISKDGYHPAGATVLVGTTDIVADAALVYIADLAVAYERVSKIKDTGYTEESWKALQTALTNAKTALDNETATQDAVNAALEALLKAERDLTLKQPDPKAPALLDPDAKHVYTGEESGITIGIDAESADLLGVWVRGAELQKDRDYTVRDGSVYVTFLPAYLDGLANGVYTAEIRFATGSVYASFTVNVPATPGPDPAPGNGGGSGGGSSITIANTGDGMVAWQLTAILLAVLAVAGLGALVFIKRRKVKSEK